MAEMLFKTKGNASPSGKPRVYFTCHKDDFDLYFEQVCEYIFKTQNCAIYYTADMNEAMSDEELKDQTRIFKERIAKALENKSSQYCGK